MVKYSFQLNGVVDVMDVDEAADILITELEDIVDIEHLVVFGDKEQLILKEV